VFLQKTTGAGDSLSYKYTNVLVASHISQFTPPSPASAPLLIMPQLTLANSNQDQQAFSDLSPPGTPSKARFRVCSMGRTYIPYIQKRLFLSLCTFVTATTVYIISARTHSTPSYAHIATPAHSTIQNQTLEDPYPQWVVGAPTASFRDNLRPEVQYITSWLSAGWSKVVFYAQRDIS
jgi:hypothetical protein